MGRKMIVKCTQSDGSWFDAGKYYVAEKSEIDIWYSMGDKAVHEDSLIIRHNCGHIFTTSSMTYDVGGHRYHFKST